MSTAVSASATQPVDGAVFRQVHGYDARTHVDAEGIDVPRPYQPSLSEMVVLGMVTRTASTLLEVIDGAN